MATHHYTLVMGDGTPLANGQCNRPVCKATYSLVASRLLAKVSERMSFLPGCDVVLARNGKARRAFRHMCLDQWHTPDSLAAERITKAARLHWREYVKAMKAAGEPQEQWLPPPTPTFKVVAEYGPRPFAERKRIGPHSARRHLDMSDA